MKYTNKLGKEYQLWSSEVYLRGGNVSKIYFFLPIGQKPQHKYSEVVKDDLPTTHEIREIGASHTPLVNRKRTNA